MIACILQTAVRYCVLQEICHSVTQGSHLGPVLRASCISHNMMMPILDGLYPTVKKLASVFTPQDTYFSQGKFIVIEHAHQSCLVACILIILPQIVIYTNYNVYEINVMKDLKIKGAVMVVW